MVARHTLAFSLLVCLNVSCASLTEPTLVSEPVVLLTKNEDRIVEMRSGNDFCQGYLIDKRKVLFDTVCVDGGQSLLLRRLTNPALETAGHIVGEKLADYAIIEADQDLAPSVTPNALGTVASGETEPAYYYNSAKRSWYLVEVHRDAEIGDYAPQKNTASSLPVFRRDGTFMSFNSGGLITYREPKAESDYEKDAEFEPYSDSSWWQKTDLKFDLSPKLAAVARTHGTPSFGFNLDLGVGLKYDRLAAEGALVVGTMAGSYYRLSYTNTMFEHFDDKPLTFKPFIGMYTTDYTGVMTGIEMLYTKNFGFDIAVISRRDRTEVMSRLSFLRLFL